MKKIVSLMLVLVMVFGMIPQLTMPARAEATTTGEFEGKTVSILGDSISTYAGISNNTDYNSTIGSNKVYYGTGALGGYENTWWQQTIDALGMELLVNNSWSGSCVLPTRAGTAGAYIDRCVNLHNDTTGEEPDVIVVFLGTNDFSYYQSTLGTSDIDYDTLITADGYATPTTTCEAYAIMLDKMISRYSNAEIYCMGMTARRSPDKEDSYADVGQPTSFNAELKQIIGHFGVTYVDLENCGIDADAEIFDVYMGDGRVHPNALGMDKITEALASAMLGKDVTLIDVAADYTGVVSSNAAAVTLSGMAYSATLTPMENYSDMAVTVTMSGVDITADCYSNGAISIAEVTGDIVITATATRAPQTFRWEYQDGELVSTGDTENALTKLNGSCAAGVFSDTRYQLAGDVILRHDLPWFLEWKGEGAGGFMLASSSNAADAPFFFRRAGNYLNAFGDHDGSKYNNYGLTYADGAANHTYRLENRIADDGSNMVYLMVDGEEIGPMIGYFVGGTAQGTTGDWISGQDFTFRYIGTSSHPLTNYAMEYLSVTECAHTYSNGLCTGCGHIAPSGIWQIIENGKVTGAFSALADAVDACREGGTICLTADCSVTSGVVLRKALTIDGGGYLVDISGCSEALITVNEGVSVTLRNLRLDGGATGFEVDYDGVTYTNYTIPLASGSLANDPRASRSAIISSGTLICENVDISNRYTASVGGAMQILAGSASLTNCDFTHNYGTSKGGALFIGSNFGNRTAYPVERVTISGCTFTGNYSGHGGAIYAYNVSVIDIADSEFVSNTANGGKGGAIDLFSETTRPTNAMALGLDFIQTTIRNCSFRGNWAGNDGFAIQSYDSDLYIYDSEFIENVGVHPTSSVGTVSIEAYRHADESYRIYTLMDGCLFDGNRGPCAVYGDHSSISDLDVTDCVFQNNVGNMSFLLYAATSHISDCQFIGEAMALGVIDARIYENYTVAPELTLTDVTFTDCDAPTELLLRKHNHNTALNTYPVILEGATNGDITVWDSNCVTINGTHTGNVQFGYGSERENLTIGSNGKVNGIIFVQPESVQVSVGDRFAITVEAEGENLSYQWYYSHDGGKNFFVSSITGKSYALKMASYICGRQLYCVITDANGNSVTTDTVTVTAPLTIIRQPESVEVELGEKFAITVSAVGEGLTYQWYYSNNGGKSFAPSAFQGSRYAMTMASYCHNRQVYCVITDRYGNSVQTETVTITRPPVELKILEQPTDVYGAKGDKFSVSFSVQGEGLTYRWYYKESWMKDFKASSNTSSAYAYTMASWHNGRQVYCVITDQYGNQVTTEIVTIYCN